LGSRIVFIVFLRFLRFFAVFVIFFAVRCFLCTLVRFFVPSVHWALRGSLFVCTFGNVGHRRDGVVRFPPSTTPDAVSKLLTSLSQCEAGTPPFPFSTALFDRHLIRFSRMGGKSPPPLGRFTCRALCSGSISAAHRTP
jgi:hypothetical protein